MDDEEPHPTPSQSEEQPENFWALVAQATSLGWNLVVPIVGGVLLGRYLDDTFDQEFTWTLSLLLMGVAVAFNNLYSMYVEHSGAEPLRKRKRTRKQRQKDDKGSENHAESE